MLAFLFAGLAFLCLVASVGARAADYEPPGPCGAAWTPGDSLCSAPISPVVPLTRSSGELRIPRL